MRRYKTDRWNKILRYGGIGICVLIGIFVGALWFYRDSLPPTSELRNFHTDPAPRSMIAMQDGLSFCFRKTKAGFAERIATLPYRCSADNRRQAFLSPFWSRYHWQYQSHCYRYCPYGFLTRSQYNYSANGQKHVLNSG